VGILSNAVAITPLLADLQNCLLNIAGEIALAHMQLRAIGVDEVGQLLRLRVDVSDGLVNAVLADILAGELVAT
jgi:hypothetical protein